MRKAIAAAAAIAAVAAIFRLNDWPSTPVDAAREIAIGVAEEVAVTTWQDDARAAARAHFDGLTQQERDESCAALRMFGITTPEAGVQFAAGLGSLEAGLSDFGLDPAAVGDVREAALIGYEVVIEGCGL